MKNILVIGGTEGIGRQVVEQLKEDQVFVVACRTDEQATGTNIIYLQADNNNELPDSSSLPEVIDGLVYCPDSINLKPAHRLMESDFLSSWQLNFTGAVKTIQAVLPHLKKAAHPSIVLFSTVAVKTGMAFHTGITAAKAAVEGLIRALAAELAPAIRVNCIAPLPANTTLSGKRLSTDTAATVAERHPVKRIRQPGNIADMACFLLSPKASRMTGQVIYTDGGISSLKL